MEVKPLTKKEQAWISELQRVVKKCPSKRMEAYTIGDNDITIYDKNAYKAVEDSYSGNDTPDVCQMVDESDSELARIFFKFGIVSSAG